MPRVSETVASRWFGVGFDRLDPLLQELHRNGGTLAGEVRIETGVGVAGWIGRRLARRLGIPTNNPTCGFTVDIRHAEDGMHWDRHFTGYGDMRSLFRPVGSWPTGRWVERSGPVSLKLAVDVVEGGWYWRLIGAAIGGLPLPLRLFPRTDAYKRIENASYCFAVAFSLPLLGKVLGYRGVLQAVPAPLSGR
jgi:hypothetical protein